MRLLTTAALLFAFITAACAQADVCTPLKKALAGSAANFDTYSNFQFLTKGGQSAYLADFSFVPGVTSYIYKDNVKGENYVYQKLTDDASTYTAWYKSVEQCLLTEKDKWTKVDGSAGNSVIFLCSATGVEVILLNGAAGITVKVVRQKNKAVPVLAADFCQQLEKLALACTQGFAPVLGNFKDSGVLGKAYQSTIQLNQRNITKPTIYISKDIFNNNTPKYSLTEMFNGYDMSYLDMITRIELCLTEAKGWKKEKLWYGDGVQFVKEEVSVSIRPQKDETPQGSFIEVGTYRKH